MQPHEIDAHIEAHEAAETSTDTSSFNATQLQLFNICNIYQKIRPIIKFVRGLLFWKPKWQTVIDQFLAVTDTACPLP